MSFSLDYLWRYVVAGLTLQFLLALFIGFDKIGILMFAHLVGAVLIFPGAAVVNFAGQRFFPSRTWTGDPRRPRLAGWLSVPLIWGVVTISALFEMEPARFLNDQLGMIGAWVVHGAGLLFVGSSLSLALGWALPPKPPVPIRRVAGAKGERG